MGRYALRDFLCLAHGPFQAMATRGETVRCPCGCSLWFVRLADDPSTPRPRPPARPVRAVPHPDEQMSEHELLSALQRLYTSTPDGGKRALAEALGFHGKWGRQSLRSIAWGRGRLFESVRRRLSRRVRQFQRGEARLEPTGAEAPRKRLFKVAGLTR